MPVPVGGSHVVSSFVVVRYNADGGLDTTFGNGGEAVTNLNDPYAVATGVALQADGRIVVSGSTTNGSPIYTPTFALLRYNTDGSLDNSFGTGGKVTTNFFPGSGANAVLVEPNGDLLAAGYALGGISGGSRSPWRNTAPTAPWTTPSAPAAPSPRSSTA